MSVLFCPVCRGAMREIDREGVTIDVCTQCRGVWLDRGELEKLAALMPAGAAADRQRGIPSRDAYPDRRRNRDDYDDDDDHRSRRRDREDDDDGPGQSRFGRFLDFFD